VTRVVPCHLCQRMSERMRVWCLRHGESEANAGVPGAISDSGLTELGRRQVMAAAQELEAEPIAGIYASTLVRARQTAELLATALGAASAGRAVPAITTMPELMEVGCTAEELRAWVVEGDLGRRAADGETGQQALARVAAAFGKFASAHPGKTVAVVGHVAILSLAAARLWGLGAAVWGAPLPNARPFLVEWDGRAWRCQTWHELREVGAVG
jgi:broad specificity phosphatase PhoE